VFCLFTGISVFGFALDREFLRTFHLVSVGTFIWDILVWAIRRLTSCLVSPQVALVLFVATRALTARH
jgi:hypothetical protein